MSILHFYRLKPDSLMEVDKTVSTSTKAHESVKEANAKSDEENITVIDESAIVVNAEEPYLPPILPNETTFIAKVSHVAEDGTVYVIQECLGNFFIFVNIIYYVCQ